MNSDKLVQQDVLIVDDNKDICKILEEFCHNMGCFKNIVFAHDGLTASQKMRNQKFAVILLDITMPKKTGLEVLNEFDADGPNSKESIIIVSGTLDQITIGKILRHNVKIFLLKPFDEPTFQNKVLKILGREKS